MVLFEILGLLNHKQMGQSHLTHNRVGRRWNRTRGFRLSHRRFSLNRLRTRFLYFIRFVSRWKSSYGQAINSMKNSITRCRSCSRSFRKMEEKNFHLSDYRLGFHGRSNSFYSEAIADCLEFIKRSSVSVDDDSVVQR
ncbi:hypothetical protein NE237_019466 [Protea cynaroides]|uniref:Uncharacterized protein n=1 Tax=Protea cynaroides TaxID=273540 RepID=A0A9Q0QPZ0_9MAGN|nr:hypothetical protein NE237_019466 [Protea cynaroides]